MRDGRTGVGVAALVGALALGPGLTGCTPDAVVQPSPSPSASSATPTETDAERQERLDYATAEKAYRTFRAEYGRVLRAGGAKEPTKVMKQTAGGEYLKEFAEVTEAYHGLGDHQEGKERILSVAPGAYSAAELELRVCEDSRSIRIIAKNGEQVGQGEMRQSIIQVRRISDAWKLWSGSGKKVSTCD
ncbi:hypothetical protein ACFFOM_02280 [Microlunatus capsulatus]|uniref:Lipoprotein n=1 Tax=Microlunatus capsulatus TaxID=99117 RepID=A0ABS4Z324_9ACTN|nr:hypothetical protein [Microlunatus capsulatus]MBP2415449.1 hypothetical protein [Microlunatus capsulatus]